MENDVYRDEPSKQDRPSQTTAALGEQNEVVNRLHGALKRLAERLSPVLREPNPETDDANKEASNLVYIAGQITANTKGVRAAENIIKDLMERLEL